MPLTLEIPEDIAESAREVATRAGKPAEKLLIEALRAHFPPISDELRAEFEEWELASEEDIANFNRIHGID